MPQRITPNDAGRGTIVALAVALTMTACGPSTGPVPQAAVRAPENPALEIPEGVTLEDVRAELARRRQAAESTQEWDLPKFDADCSHFGLDALDAVETAVVDGEARIRRIDGIAGAAADAVELVLRRHGVYRGNWIEPNFPWRHMLEVDVREERDDTFVTVTWHRPFPGGGTVTVASRNVWIEHDRRPPDAPRGLPARVAREAARAAESFASEYLRVNAAHCRL